MTCSGLIAGSLGGASVLVLIFCVELATYGLALRSYLVRRDDALERYAVTFIASQLRLIAAAVVVGSGFGLLGTSVGHLWSPGAEPGWAWGAARGAASAVVGHVYFLVQHVIRYPQPYSPWLYAHGGWRQKLMVLLTDRVPPRVWDRTCLTILSVSVAVPLVVHHELAEAFVVHSTSAMIASTAFRYIILGGGGLVLALAALIWMRRSRGRLVQEPGKPNLLLLALDSLRPDRVFAPDAAERFPALAQLASRGVRFREAYVTIARTFSSWAAFLTGRFPQHHGIWHMFPDASARAAIGATLIDALRERGYATAVISDFAGDIFPRAPMGFSDVDAPACDIKSVISGGAVSFHFNSLPYVSSRLGRRLFPEVAFLMELADPELIADRVVRKLDKYSSRPFAINAFFSTTHFPYAAPYPYYRRFTKPEYRGPFRYGKPWVKYEKPPNAADREQIQAVYDGAVLAADRAIARILEQLEKSGVMDNTVIVVIGDHGEDLYDEAGVGQGHGDNLDGVSDHFPIVIIDPIRRFPPHDVTGLVRDVDLAPTLASLLGVTLTRVDGTSLVPMLDGSRDTLNLDAFSSTELWFFKSGMGFERDKRLPYPELLSSNLLTIGAGGEICLSRDWEARILVAMHRAIRTERWKLTYRPTRTGVRWTLHDLAQSPGKARDVAAAHPDVVAELRSRLEQWICLDERVRFVNGFAVLTAASVVPVADHSLPTLHLRVEQGRKETAVTGVIRAEGSIQIKHVLNGEASLTEANELTFRLRGEAGLDITVDPATSPIHLTASRDGVVVDAKQILVGEFGLPLLRSSRLEWEHFTWLDTDHGPFLDDHRSDSGDIHLWRSHERK